MRSGTISFTAEAFISKDGLQYTDKSKKDLLLLRTLAWKIQFSPSEMVFCSKIVLTYCENCSSDREKLLKFEAETREFSKILRSLEQFIQTVKGQTNIW